MGRLLQSTQRTESHDYGMSYEYNLAGEMTSETYPSGRKIATSYDSAGRINEVKEANLNKLYVNGVSYTAHGAVAALTLGNSLIEQTAFNTRLQPTQIKLGTAGSSASVLQLDYSYETAGQHDNNGNVRTQTINVPNGSGGTAVMTQSYAYDALNRLQSMSESNGGWTQTYGYDRFGNRWVSAGNVPNSLLTPQSSGAFDQATNKIKPSVMPGFAYGDTVGNLTSMPYTASITDTMAYDAENRQVSHTRAGVTTSYSYDGDGHRVKKVTSGSPTVTTVYVYGAMGHLVAEYTDSTPPQGGGTKYLTADHLESTRVVTGQDQSVKARYDYLPFGEEMGAGVGLRTAPMGYSATENTRQKFTAKERDSESGLDYFLARYYSNTQGRFTSPDEFAGGPDEFCVLGSGDSEKQALPYAEITRPQSLNKYQYCYNNPLRFIDPDGHQDGFEIRFQNLQQRLLKKEITEKQYWEALRGEALGAAVGLAVVGAAMGAVEVGPALLLWAARNPDKVEQIVQDLVQASTGNPAPAPRLGTPLSKIFNVADEVIASGRYVEGRLGAALIGGQFTKSGDKLTAGIIGTYANDNRMGTTLHALFNSIKDFARSQGVSTVEIQAIAVVNKDLEKALIKQGFQKATVLVDGEKVEAFVKTINIK